MLAFFTVGCKTDDDDDGETPSPTSYSITIAEGIEHGSVSASPTTAAASATVTLTATPADGYKLASLTVTNAGGASVTTTKDSSDTSKYTFIMPASNVTVSAVFVEESAATYTITIADSIEHGSVFAEPTTAAAGTSVTLTVTLADGYELNTISVKDANSADVAVTQDSSDKSKYTFTMPASDVTVSATFTEEATTLSTPLTLKALTAGTIVVDSPQSGMQYSKNGGAKTAMTETTTIEVAIGDTVAFYGSGTSITSYYGTNIAGGTAEVKAYGNIMSLVDEEGFATATTLAAEAFFSLFQENAKLKDAGELLLPADTLAQVCYTGMFIGCTSLTEAPALPATTLADSCYTGMFAGCTSLTEAPALPATTLVYSCYSDMFAGCTSLTEAPALPATTLGPYCYDGMFSDCTSLTAAPALPATTLAESCYRNMFSGCSSLNAVTCLATDVSAGACTTNWLNGVATSGTFTTPKDTSWSSDVNGIPNGWTRLNPDGSEYVNLLTTPLTLKALTAGTIVVDNPKSGMQYSKNGGAKTAVTSEAITVAEGDTVAFYGSGTNITSYSGTKIAGGTAEVKAYGNIMSLVDEEGFATATALADEAFYGLFRGNAKLKDAGELLLPADTLAQGCYSSMFDGCTSLTAAPALPATSLAEDCYGYMFDGCTSLTAAPALPATSLAEDCYGYMFCGCSSLTAAPALPATSLAQNCYYYMFCACSSLTEAPVLPATTLAPYCYDDMFWKCSNLKAVTCLATDISATDCTHQWLDSAGTSVTGTKTFTTPKDTNWSSGKSGIPSGWTRVDAN